MDITSLVFIGLMIIIGVLMFSILPVLTYLLYKVLRKKGKIQKNIGLAIFVLTLTGMIIFGIKLIFGPSGFGPEYEKAEIKQNIGGTLICNSVYYADIHSWQYNIDYKYIDLNGGTIDFDGGSYYGREWKKDEQIFKFDKFLILKTGAWYGSDRLIIKNALTDSTKIFDIDNEFIEKDSLWKAEYIHSLLNYCCAETFIERINGNEISLKYKFRTDGNLPEKYGVRMIIYQLDKETGDIKMTKIK